MIGYLDALGMVKVHGMREVRAVGDDAICGSRTLAGVSCAAPQEHEEARRRSKGLVMRNYIRIGVPSQEARGTEIPATKVQEEYGFFRLSGYLV